MRYYLTLVILAGLASLARADVPAQLLRNVPAGANALAVIDVGQLFSSPLAQRESWAAAYADAYGAAPLLVPSDTTSMVLAADLDFEFLKPRWEVVVLDVAQARTAESIAARTRGVVDLIAGQPAVETPLGAYIVQLAPRRLGVLAPATRQAVARWVEQPTSSAQVSLSPYLLRMTQQVQQAKATIGLAVDLANVVSLRTVRGELSSSEALSAHNISADRAAQALASVQGLTLLVTAGDQLRGTLTIDFGDDISFLGPAASALVLEEFRRLGASMDQWKGWKTAASGKALTMTGQLAAGDLRQVFSLFRLSRSQPVDPLADQPQQAKPARGEGFNAMAKLSQRYLQSATSHITQLERSMQGASPYQFALWLDNCASSIDTLPAGGVDPDLVKYGQSVSSQLRALLATLNSLDQQAGMEQAHVTPSVRATYGMLPTDYTVNYGGYRMRRYVPFGFGQVDASDAVRQRREIQQQALDQATSAARETFANIQAETESIRKTLAERYDTGF